MYLDKGFNPNAPKQTPLPAQPLSQKMQRSMLGRPFTLIFINVDVQGLMGPPSVQGSIKAPDMEMKGASLRTET